jgi:isoleucyl-tRNA synthetase
VRRLQDLRRESGLEVSDRITVRYAADAPSIAQAFADHGDYIAEETLALSIEEGAVEDGWASVDATIDGDAVTLALRKAAT